MSDGDRTVFGVLIERIPQISAAIGAIAIGMSVVYEFGYFLKAGMEFFGFFSLTNLISNALRTVPYAIFTVVLGTLHGSYRKSIREKVDLHAKPDQIPPAKSDQIPSTSFVETAYRGWRRALNKELFYGVLGMVLAVLMWEFSPGFAVVPLAMASYSFEKFVEVKRKLYDTIPLWVDAGINGAGFIMFVGFIGGQAAVGDMTHSRSMSHTITLTDHRVVVGNLMQKGERGVLLFADATKRPTLISWSQIESIEQRETTKAVPAVDKWYSPFGS